MLTDVSWCKVGPLYVENDAAFFNVEVADSEFLVSAMPDGYITLSDVFGANALRWSADRPGVHLEVYEMVKQLSGGSHEHLQAA